MTLRNTQTNYGTLAKFFHWVVALMILTLLTVGYIMSDMDASDQKWQMYGIHKASGLTVLTLVAMRLIWRLLNETPTLPTSMPRWQVLGAQATVALLYVLMFAMPISGVVMSLMGGHPISYFGLFEIPAIAHGPTEIGKLANQAHTYFSYALIATFVLHVLGAIYHHFILKDNVTLRMYKNIPE